MPNKKQETYNIVFKLIVSQRPEFGPVKFHCDIEIGAINALQESFPDVELRGCFTTGNKLYGKNLKKLVLKARKRRD